MQRVASILLVFLAFCSPLIAQEPAASGRISVTARFVPNGGNPVTSTIPEVVASEVVLPLQISPDATWLVTVNPASSPGQMSVAVADTLLLRNQAGNVTAATPPVPLFRGTLPFAYGRPVIVLQTGTYRLEVQITKL